jgi:two-component system response regulator FlrC
MVRAMVLSYQRSIELEHLLFDDLHINDEFSEPTSEYVPQSDRSLNWTQGSPNHGITRPKVAGVTQRGSILTNERAMKGSNVRSVLDHAVQQSERQAITEALQSSRSRDEAAEKLGISPRTLRHKLQKLREQGINVTRAYAR